MASTRLGYLALKKETTKAVAVKPTHFLRYKGGDVGFNQETIENNPIQNNRWNSITAVPGKISTDADFDFDVDLKEIGHILYAALGGYTKETVSGVAVKHTFNTSKTLPTYTIEQLKGNDEGEDHEVIRAYGAMVDDFEISASDGIAEMKAKIKAHGVFVKGTLTETATAGTGATVSLKDTRGLVASDLIKLNDSTNNENTTLTTVATQKTITATLANGYAIGGKVELRPQTPSYSPEQILVSFVHASFQFGATLAAAASAVYDNLENWTFSYMNQLEERYGSAGATPSVIAPKGAGAKIKFTKYFENSDDRDRYLDLAKQAGILTLDIEKKIGATSQNYKIVIKMSDLRFISYEMPTGQDDLYALDMEASCFYDGVEGKAIEIELYNDVADYAA